MKRAVGGLLTLAVTACGGPARQAALSHTDYLGASTAAAGLTRLVKAASLRLCYSDATASQQHQDDVKYAVLAWIEPLRALTKEPLATTVELVGAGDACDAAIDVGNFSPAYTQMGTHPTVHVNYSGWYGSRTVTLHEFGHAFGLLDTYVGRGGGCQAGQPDSVMCWASYEQLQPDDIAGVQDVFQRVESGALRLEDERTLIVR